MKQTDTVGRRGKGTRGPGGEASGRVAIPVLNVTPWCALPLARGPATAWAGHRKGGVAGNGSWGGRRWARGRTGSTRSGTRAGTRAGTRSGTREGHGMLGHDA